jgi:hypothetical protein
MDKFLDTYDLPKLIQENIKNLNISIMSNKIDAVIGSLNKGKQRTRWILCSSLPTFKELTPLLLQIVHEIEREGVLPKVIP